MSLANLGSFVNKSKSKPDVCLAQSRKALKEKQRRILANRFNLDSFIKSPKSRLCERSEAISQFVADWKNEIAASLRSSQ
jgi:hypothetical protein